jgi:hypothetical protein
MIDPSDSDHTPTATTYTGNDDDSREIESRRVEIYGRLYGRPKLDIYGRPVRRSVAGLDGTEFTGILPDNPFGVIRGPFAVDGNGSSGGGGGVRTAMPILQFWTWRTELLVTIRRDTQDT